MLGVDPKEPREEPPWIYQVGLLYNAARDACINEEERNEEILDFLRNFLFFDLFPLQIDLESIYHVVKGHYNINEPIEETRGIIKELSNFKREEMQAFDLFHLALKHDSKNEIDKFIEKLNEAHELCPENPVYLMELREIWNRLGNSDKVIEIEEKMATLADRIVNGSYFKDFFNKSKENFQPLLNNMKILMKKYSQSLDSDNSLIKLLKVLTSDIISYLNKDNRDLTKKEALEMIDNCLLILEFISNTASLALGILKGTFQENNIIKNNISSGIELILGWTPPVLPLIQTPNFLSPVKRKSAWGDLLGTDPTNLIPLEFIREAEYIHVDGNPNNDDPSNHMWVSKSHYIGIEMLSPHEMHDIELINKIQAHIEKYFCKNYKILHETRKDLVHVDIHIIPPSKSRNYSLLITSGMSEIPMNPPKDAWKWWELFVPKLSKKARKSKEAYSCKWAELVVKLPPDWPIPDEKFVIDEYSWPIGELLHLAKYVHENKTWFWDGHTIGDYEPNGTTLSDNTKLSGWLFHFPSMYLPKDFPILKVSKSKIICFLQLIPLYPEEIRFVIHYGKKALFMLFNKLGIKDYLDINRINACKH